MNTSNTQKVVDEIAHVSQALATACGRGDISTLSTSDQGYFIDLAIAAISAVENYNRTA